MKREIKFRAWKAKSQEMVYKGIIDYWIKHSNEPDVVGETYIIEQFTGLYDSTGRGVYEGDKITLIGDSDFSKFDGWIVSMRWPSYILLVSPDGLDAIPYFGFEYHANIGRVVGNIHESPEVVK